MKKLLYLGAMLTFVGSLSLTGYEKTQAASAKAAIAVRLCSSAPVGVPGDAHIVQGMWHGVSVANATWRGKFRRVGLNLATPLLQDDAKSDGSAVDAAKEAANAHACLNDPAAVGSVSTLNSSMAQ